jgi:hypothetical protein
MNTFQIEAEVAPGGVLILEHLPFLPGERVAVTIAQTPVFPAMRAYAEQLADYSAEIVNETDRHITERLLRETAW